VQRPDVWLETTADGRFNARFDREQKDTESGAALGAVQLDEGVLHFIEKHRGTDLEVRFENNTGTGAAASKLAARIGGRWRGLATELQAVGDPLLRLRQTDRPYALDVSGAVGTTKLKAAGTVTGLAQPTAVDLKVHGEGRSLGEWYRIIGVGLPNTPPYRTEGRLRLADGAWHYEQFSARIGNSDVSGQVRFEPREQRPFIGATLQSQRLDLRDFLPLIGKEPPPPTAKAAPDKQGRKPKQPKATGSPTARVLPQWSLSSEKWDTLDANVRLDGQSIRNLGQVPIEKVKMQVRLDDRKLSVDPLQFALAGGELTGSLAIDGAREPMAARIELQGRRLKLDQLLPVVDNERLALGTVNAKLKLAGRGESFGQMLGSADGEAQLAMGRGQVSNLVIELVGLDAQEALGFLVRGDKPVAVRCALVDVGIKDGVMSTRNVVFDTNDTLIEASGQANLAKEQLDLRVRPLPKDASLLSLRVPFDVKGTFKQPQVSPDRGKLALRAGGALLLGSVAPLAALIPLIETGPGEDADCNELVGRAKKEGVPVQNELPNEAPAAGRPKSQNKK
jgi:uncharacterized protein involved in outer membrane biogenesis